MSRTVSRRRLLFGAAGAVGVAGFASAVGAGLLNRQPSLVKPTADVVARTEATRRRTGTTVTAKLTARPSILDLGGPTVPTWAYGESLPGPLLRARAGDLLHIEVVNQLPVGTSVHWHGLAVRNDMDGVSGITQPVIEAGGRFTYEFVASDPGTYWYHPHVGVQVDRGLYGLLILDDPADAGRYDVEWTVVFDDWVDGTGGTPDDVLRSLAGMAGMHHGGGRERFTSSLLGGAGSVAYPHYLANGRVPTAPATLSGKPRQRARLRLVNAGADTAFRVALGGHRLTVTHTDGFPVMPVTVDALLLGMGERLDVRVDLADGVFPLVALAEGKSGNALALVRTGAGTTPDATARPDELDRVIGTAAELRAAPRVRLPHRTIDRTHDLILGGGMMPYRWTINDATFDESEPLLVEHGERVRLRFVNDTAMFHPMHLHGHTFALAGGGPRKDTVIVRPQQMVLADFDATNPGRWMIHCHNIYHAEAGMMIGLGYLA
ncbi:MAG TPA: multicopper oxidase family protein [Pilimelia sp.]|nr:multicopper oxidase family protein [Pilimelia sp.]